MSVLSEEGEGVDQKFEGDDADFVPADDGPADSKPEEEQEAEPKKKKVIRRVVKSVKKAGSSSADAESTPRTPAARKPTRQGDALTDGDGSVLRCVLYFVSEESTEASEALLGDITDTMESLVVKTDNIGTILDVAAMDHAATGKDASVSLGISDGVVDEDCTLPRLLKKLGAASPGPA